MTYFGRPVIPHWIRHRALRTLCSTQVIGRLIAALEVMQSDQEGFLGMLVRDLEAVLLCDELLNQTSLAIRSIRWSMLTISQRRHQDSLDSQSLFRKSCDVLVAAVSGLVLLP